jgi:FkbM family methyltransferase
VLAAILREGDVVLDVGAHVGLTVLPAARKVGPTGRVIAFEPGSRTGGLLRRSLALNFLSERVLFYPYAAGDLAGRVFLNLGSVLGHSSLLALPGSESGEEVETRTVDSLVAPGTPIRLAKLDAEGFEPRVWRGMQRVISDNPELIVIVEFGPEHLRRAGISIEDWLAEFLAPGFSAYEVDEETSHLRPLRSVAQLAAVHSLNLLLLRQPTGVFPELQFK